MFDSITYILIGAWQGSFSLVLCVVGVLLMTLPYLVQPVLGYKCRFIISYLFIVLGIAGIVFTLRLAHQEVSMHQYQQLRALASANPLANATWTRHIQTQAPITNIDYFLLERRIIQHKHRVMISS
jgi:hypothetical protein